MREADLMKGFCLFFYSYFNLENSSNNRYIL